MRGVMSALALVLLARTAAGAPLQGDVAAIPTVEASRSADVAVVVYREVIGEIAGPDRGPTLTVFGDGRIVAHYPVYMKRAGDWERRLSRQELDALLGSLAVKGVLDFDAPTVRAAARAAEESTRARDRAAGRPLALVEVSDPSTTIIEMTVERYVSATPGARTATNIAKRVAWTGLRTDAAEHPEVPALRDLAAAERELRALRDSSGFTPVP